MSVGEYFQEYGPVHRRRTGHGPLVEDEPGDITRPRYRDHSETTINDEIYTLPRTRSRAAEREDATTCTTAESSRARINARREARRRQVTAQPLHPPFSWSRLLLGTVVMVVIVLLALPYIIHLQYRGRTLPGVTLQGLAIGTLSRDSIESTLSARYADFLDQPVTLVYDTQTWYPTPSELGITVAFDQVATDALQVGREGNPITRLHALWTLWRSGVDIAPRLTVDQRQIQNYLVGLHTSMNRPPRDAALSISAQGTIVATPAAPGIQILVNESTSDVLLALQTLSPQQITLRTRTLAPTITDDELHIAEIRATSLLTSDLVLSHGERSWTWTPADLVPLLRVEPVHGSMAVRVDEERLREKVAGLAQLVDSGSVEPRVRFENGNLMVTREGQQGWRLQQEEAVQVISTTWQKSHERTIALPVEEITPRVTPDMLASLGIHELVGEGRSSFAGSEAYRITNIKAGVAAMDGVLIAPDEEFSFNTQLGPVDGDHGFVQGYAIVNSRTALEWGGGVCQNSTTVFRAAFWAGLPITEWHPHPFYLNWYDPFGYGPQGNGAGMDATIFTGVQDFKFVNDTGNWLLLQFYVDDINQVITVHLYGTRLPGREVRFDGPYVNNQRGGGASDITIFRTIVENGVQQEPEAFFTSFKPW